MRKILLSLLLFLTACASLGPIPAGTPQPSATPSSSFTVKIHPDGRLYAGDLLSFEVLSPTDFQTSNKTVNISLAGKPIAEKSFESFGIGRRTQATFTWVWDTRGLKAGNYTLSFALLPDGTSWNETINLHPEVELSALEKDARWRTTTTTTCCTLYTISGTDADQDLNLLKSMVDVQAADVESRMGTKLKNKIPITFLPRTIGHGGFASDAIYVSYLHENYAGGAIELVVHHEMVHWVDGSLGDGGLRPSILEEGLAVYLSGGHFKMEPIVPRSAAILQMGWFIPLRPLADSFYFSQHEISYTEAAGLISYMVSTYGWKAFNTFYRDIRPTAGGSQADALDKALQDHFSISLDRLEQNYKAFLSQQTVDQTTKTDMRLTVAYYDAVRRYQVNLDPSAYFLNAWLPDVPSMRQRGIVADFLRHPDGAINRQIEDTLVAADSNLRTARYTLAEVDIRTVNALLDVWDR
jgi:hypothetical protein